MNQQRQRGIAATREGKIKLEQAKAATRDENKNNRPWTYAKIAEVAGCEETTVKAFFGKKGKNDRVDKSYALAIVQALALEPDDIIDVSDITNSINWKKLCTDAFKQEQERRKRATEMGHEVEVYVPLGLVKRKVQPRRKEEEMPGAEAGMEQYALTEKEIEQRYEHQEFLAQVIGNAGKNLAIIGEPGAGKTTWLDQIGQELIKRESYPIWIPLARLQGMTLEDFLLEKWLKEKLGLLQPTGEQKQAFVDWFKTEKVWVLLDGVDEMSAALPVVEIRESLRGWVNEARVVLSCRLNVWESNPTTLGEFETYRTLCFEPEQVEQFIAAWFEREQKPELGKQLAQKLQEAESARILDLVRNPLRLSLLCKSWVNNPGEIPVTKADLYQQLCRDVYGWKQDQFPTTLEEQQQLNQRLAELALRGMSENVPLREALVHEVLGEWFQLAENVGWLNVVYRDIRTDEPVYAFFHLTFQEYFAACAVADGHFFLPSDHSPEHPSSQPYRIFESRWREVILLWLGRGDVEDEKKEEFIQALVSFDDGCRFYENRAYFLAAAGISEFKACSLADEIVRNIVKWGFGHFNIEKQRWLEFLLPLRSTARNTIHYTDRQRAISQLSDTLQDIQCPVYNQVKIAEFLGSIDPNNQKAIETLINILQNDQYSYIHWQAAQSLSTIDSGNNAIITSLLNLIQSNQHENTRIYACFILSKVRPQDPRAVATLIDILDHSNDEEICWRSAYYLDRIDPGNEVAFMALLKIFKQTNNRQVFREVCWRLGDMIVKNNYLDKIDQLLYFLQTTQKQDVAHSLGRIVQGNPNAISILLDSVKDVCNINKLNENSNQISSLEKYNKEDLMQLLEICQKTEDEYTHLGGAYILGKLSPTESIPQLLKIFKNTDDNLTQQQATALLRQVVTTDQQRQTIVSALEHHFADKTYETNFDLYENCYELLWNIAQDLPYPDFYRAWHHLHTAPHPEVADQTPVGKTALTDTLNAQLRDLPNQLHPTPHTTPVWVDIEHLTPITDEDKLAKAFSTRIFRQLFPGETLPKITDSFDLEAELTNAQLRHPHIALILHNGEPQECLLHLCRFLAPTVSIAWITPTPLDAPLRGFLPEQEHLVSALQSWLEQLTINN